MACGKSTSTQRKRGNEKELFENQLQSLPIKTEQEVKKEKEREQTVDWMTKWFQQQSRDLER
jgi:hypothetical protein